MWILIRSRNALPPVSFVLLLLFLDAENDKLLSVITGLVVEKNIWADL